jgi:hypothetical protein
MLMLSGLTIDPLPPRTIMTHFEIRCIKDGRPTPLADQADTLNQAREHAAYKARVLGFEKFLELDPVEKFSDATADGVYIVTVQTEMVRAQEATRIQSFEECNRRSFMDEKLWAGVELKLQSAEFFFEMMGRSLQPPKQTSINVALQASGAIIDTDWQRSFYAYLDAFLSTARSVPEIIQSCLA